jgi:two-component system sensor histidine kinase BarA
MQGRISLTSELHKGSKFTIKIRLEKMASFESEKHPIVRFSKLKAICFDENPLQRKALCNALGFLGISSISVANFRQLEKAFNKKSEGLIAFIHVNEGSEKLVADIVKRHKIPTILISKWLIHNHEALGAKGFLFKPIGIQKLQDTIESLLKNTKPTVNKRRNQQNLKSQIKAINPDILIAEDNPLNQMLLQSMLQENAQLKMVMNGEDAVIAANEKQYQILLLDLQMPKLDGIQAARKIREKSSLNKTTPIVLISANISDIERKEISDAGIDLCLQKPIDEKQFLSHIFKLLKRERKEGPSHEKTTAIDWPLCIQKMSDNEALAKEYLGRFVEELPKEKKTFKLLISKKDISGIEKAAHKLLGACCFCGVPRLEERLRRLEIKAKKAKKINEVGPIIIELLRCIDEVTEEHRRLGLDPT